ncbi:NUDIX domain-containing protein [Streptomyces cavernicola]|uniref:NUDIX domain-containing protein n=1 Tax=Streptomyces cavernicola TaxID=3043613 RepID=A0ABT6SMM0_9ACTN|nr:NUDIX domain-containing protein [Streptomyces sp. B-S-A6]MDI3408922.1 NUDIX domain-containing protein [Streptomyces sp. B-S-A6]
MDPKPRIRNSAKAVIVHEGRVLLTRNLWEGQERHFLPGGGQRPGEALPDAVEREVLEETGLTVVADRLLFVHEKPYGHEGGQPVHRVEITFLCTLTGSPELPGGHNEDPEQLGLEWVPLGEVLTLRTLDPDYRERIAALEDGDTRGAVYLGRRG